MRWRWSRAFASHRTWLMLLQVSRAWEEHRALSEAVQVSAKTLRNSVDHASTLKPSCRRDSRVRKNPSRADVVKRVHRNVWAENFTAQYLSKGCRGWTADWKCCQEDFRGSLDIRLECRTRAVRICKAALRHPWIHSPHCSVDGDLQWSCSKCTVRNCRASVVVIPSTVIDIRALPTVIEECAKIVRDLGAHGCFETPGSAKHRAAQRYWLDQED